MKQPVTLVIVAHMDDEALNCGGLIAKRISQGHDVHVVVAFGRKYPKSSSPELLERQESHFLLAKSVLGYKNHDLLHREEGEPHKVGFYDLLLPLEDTLEALKPTEVIIPSAKDLNQDHKHLYEVCTILLRAVNRDGIKRILVSDGYDGTLTEPTYFVPLSKTEFSSKVSAISCYTDEWRDSPHPRSVQGIESKHKLYGTFCGEEFAEGYHIYYQKD